MSPEKLAGNMWRLFQNEFVEGEGGKIDGSRTPIIREQKLEGNFLQIQGGEQVVIVQAEDFLSAVQRSGN